MDLRTTGMEFASEMVIKATQMKMRMDEVPTTLSPDGRSRPPHLRPYRDGWRHLRFMLLFSPNWLFLYPGLALMVVTFVLGGMLVAGPVSVGGAPVEREYADLLRVLSADRLSVGDVFAAVADLCGAGEPVSHDGDVQDGRSSTSRWRAGWWWDWRCRWWVSGRRCIRCWCGRSRGLVSWICFAWRGS